MIVMATEHTQRTEEISKLCTEELIEFLKIKFQFSDEVLSKFPGMTVLFRCNDQFCISVQPWVTIRSLLLKQHLP